MGRTGLIARLPALAPRGAATECRPDPGTGRRP